MYHTNQKVIKNKVGLLNLAEELGNISKACQIMGLSRETFYRYRNAVEDGGVNALLEVTRKKPNRKNRIEESIEQAGEVPVNNYLLEAHARHEARIIMQLEIAALAKPN